MTMPQIDTAIIESEVRYAFEFHSRSGAWEPLDPSIIQELVRDFSALASATSPLRPGEFGIVSLIKPKTAALVADRVWLQFPGNDSTVDFAFGWDLPLAFRLAALFALIQRSDDPPPSTSAAVRETLTGPAAEFLAMTEGMLARDYSVKRRAAVAPLFESAERRDAVYSAGRYPVVVAVVAEVTMVDEDALSWEQIHEFRNDIEARRSYRRFIHWLDQEMIGRSSQFIVDELQARLGAYEWALRKHGIQTALGTLERTLSVRSLIGAGGAATALSALTAQPLWALLAGAGTMIGHAVVHVGSALLSRHDIVESNSDVAFVHRTKGLAAR